MNTLRATALAIIAASLASGQTNQAMDEEYARLVKEWTTAPEYMSPLVDHLPKVPGVPTTKDVLGYYVGAPKKLTRTADLAKYYRALAAASKRVKLFPIGTTDEGRECLVVAIADEDTIRNLDIYKARLARLADPRGLSPEQARQVIAEAKPIYMFTGGLHSAETGPPEMLMELAYRLAVDESALFQNIRKNVIVFLSAAAEPDGRDRYVDWYYKYKLTEENEQDRAPGPPYWGKYIFHDNNRDINYSQATMKNWLKFYLEWHPPIMHDLHESQPLLYTFSGTTPQNPTLDPILYSELPWFADFEMTRLIGYGMPGVWTHAFVDMWAPGYLGFMSSNHNGMLRMYETFGNGGANTMRRTIGGGGPGGGGGEAGPAPADPSSGAERAAGAVAGGGGGRGGRGGAGGGGGAAAGGGGAAGAGMTARDWFRPLPPPRNLTWSMRNNTNYMETGVLSALELTAAFPKIVLENFYKKSRNSVDSGSTDAPYGYVFPASQKDLTRVAFIVNILRTQGIEVGQATSEIKLGNATYPAGSLVVKRNQPYGRLAKILLEKQDYPDPALTTYDDTAWTMGLMSHAEVVEVADKAILNVPVTNVDVFNPAGAVKGGGPVTAILHNGSNHLVTLRYRLKDIRFDALDQPVKAGGVELPAGTFLVATSERVKSEVEKLGLQAVSLAVAPEGRKHAVDIPRLAMFSTWGATQDVGWVRYAFDKFEINYDLIYKDRVREGNLRAAYDVIVIPSQGGRGGSRGLIFDIEPKPGKKYAYKKDPEFPTLGMYGESDDITGGMGLPGVGELDKFVNAGGTLITLGASSFLPADFGITRTVQAARTTAAFYAPGPIVEAEIANPTHPIFYGYTQRVVPVRWAGGPLLTVLADERRRSVLAQFPGQEKSVLSGLMRGVAETRMRPAIVDEPVGQGRVILFSTNPAYRWQNLGEFNMLVNSILHTKAFPKGE